MGLDVTVFLISCGEPDYEASKRALMGQDVDFVLKEIRDVTPMSSAFQKMLDECETKWFVQVDADMILSPCAVREMHETAESATEDSEKIGFFVFPILDSHLGFNIQGVKIYRHDVMVNFPYRDVYSCEVDQIQRMQSAGFKHLAIQPELLLKRTSGFPVMGTHSPTWTPDRIFNRYKRLMQKHRRFGYEWVRDLPKEFLSRALNTRDETEIWAFLGAVTGLTGGLDADQEDNRSSVDKDFDTLREYLK